MKKNRVSQDPLVVFKGRQIGKAFLSIPTDELIARKERLEEALTSNEPFRQRRMTRNGPVWETWTRQQIIEAIQNHDAAIQEERARNAEEDRLVKEGLLIRAHGDAAWSFLETKVKAHMFEGTADLVKKGKRKADADLQRSATMKAKAEECPIDHFELEEIKKLAQTTTNVTDIGLFLIGGPIDFSLKRFTPDSLSKAFAAATGIDIKPRTWRKWKDLKLTMQQKNDKRTRYARRFKGF